MLTPCFEGGESLLIQIDGWGGQTGTVELSIQSTDLTESLVVGASVSGSHAIWRKASTPMAPSP